MKLIHDLLDTYKKLRPPHDTVRREFIELLQSEYNIDVPFKSVTYTDGVITVNAHPSIKNTLFINKQSILQKLNRSNVVDIR